MLCLSTPGLVNSSTLPLKNFSDHTLTNSSIHIPICNAGHLSPPDVVQLQGTIADFYILYGFCHCKEQRLTIPCNGVDKVQMTTEDGSRQPCMTSVLYIRAPIIQPPYPFLHQTPPDKKQKSGPKYLENIGPQAKICPQSICLHIGHVPRLSRVLPYSVQPQFDA